MTVHANIRDLIAQEIRPALRTDDTLTDAQVDAIADDVCTRMEAAGLVVWDDGWSDALGVHWLPAQGFRLVTTDDDGAAFWGIVRDALDQLDQQ